jgi:hypothetical protein
MMFDIKKEFIGKHVILVKEVDGLLPGSLGVIRKIVGSDTYLMEVTKSIWKRYQDNNNLWDCGYSDIFPEKNGYAVREGTFILDESKENEEYICAKMPWEINK